MGLTMPKEKTKGKEPAKVEERYNKEFWSHLDYAPSKYLTSLMHIALRLQKIIDKSKLESNKKFAKKTQELVEALAVKMNNDCEPKPPKVLEDSYNYALSRKYEGTFLALLDEDNHLVKTVIVAKERLKTLPSFKITEETVEMQMKARFINVPSLNIKRGVPKKAVKVVPFSSDMKQVYAYKES